MLMAAQVPVWFLMLITLVAVYVFAKRRGHI